MPSPFPGMDPYLESPDLWPDVHHGIIGQIQALLNRLVRPNYVARVELRIYKVDEDDPALEILVPDVRVEMAEMARRRGATDSTSALVIDEPMTIRLLLLDDIEEARVEIRHRESDSLVTVIEVVSPSNKVIGSQGRASFLAKRREVLNSEVHWVEIDLLRAGEPSVTPRRVAPSDYRILVARAESRRRASYWPRSVRRPLPTIGVPLRGDDPDVPLDLKAILAAAYRNGAYDASIDYRKEAVPPLIGEDATWADRLLRRKKLR